MEETEEEVEGASNSFLDEVRVEKMEVEVKVKEANVLDGDVRVEEPTSCMEFIMEKEVFACYK